MNKLLNVFLMVILVGCSERADISEKEQPIVVQTSIVIERQSSDRYEFPALVSEVRNVELKFEVSGRLVKTNLVMGTKIKKGEVLAQLDPASFVRKVKEKEVLHESASKDLVRIKELFNKGVISQHALDDAEKLFKTTLLSLNEARENLGYCTIFSPFDAYISKRHVENNSFIKAGDSIATLQDRSKLYFLFEVPEQIMVKNVNNKNFEATAKLLNSPQIFNINYVEYGATPDPVTQTYKVTFEVDNTQDHILIPGSRAIVTIVSNVKKTKELLVPTSALYGDKVDGFNVWVFNEKFQRVNSRKVRVVKIIDSYAVIDTGVYVGDKIISAGVSKMKENLLVREFKG